MSQSPWMTIGPLISPGILEAVSAGDDPPPLVYEMTDDVRGNVGSVSGPDTFEALFNDVPSYGAVLIYASFSRTAIDADPASSEFVSHGPSGTQTGWDFNRTCLVHVNLAVGFEMRLGYPW